jgi:molybdate transport system substrate-binding protein
MNQANRLRLRIIASALVVLAATLGWVRLQDHASPRPGRSIRVAAASDLRFALEAVIDEFHNLHSDLRVETVYGSSGMFFAQILQGAPYDLFLSADSDYPRRIAELGHGDPESVFSYGVGRIVFWVPNDSTFVMDEVGPTLLQNPAVKKIALANPQHAPYGRLALEALKRLGLDDQVEERLVFVENVAQAAQAVESGAADVGLIALSLALAPTLHHKGRFWLVPASVCPGMEQRGVILRNAKEPVGAAAFVQFLTRGPGREILRRHGTIPAGD